MKKFIAGVLTALIFAVAASAQTVENQPVLFDEFGKMSPDDAGMRLQNLWLEVEKTKDSKALIRIYGGREKSFAFPYIIGSVFKDLWAIYKLPAEKMTVQFCNVNNEPFSTRTFIVSENDRIEACKENLFAPKETVFFESIEFFMPQFELKPIELRGGWEGAPQGYYSAYAQTVLKGMLGESPPSKVYIIGYLQADQKTNNYNEVISKKIVRRDRRALSRQMTQAVKNELVKNNIPASQIVTIDGGYVVGDNRRAEIWFVPADGEIPKPKPDYIPKKRK